MSKKHGVKKKIDNLESQGLRLYTLEVFIYPKVIKRVGKSPPQYLDEEE